MARHPNYLLAIDPGLAGTGWALWTQDREAPTRVGVMVAPRGDDLAVRCSELAHDLPADRLDSRLIVVCEYPEFQESTGRSMGWRTGDLQKLTFLVGFLAGWFVHAQFVPVRPSTWKGQLPKEVVMDRITTRLGRLWVLKSGVKTHAWDAVGIGLWFKDLQKEAT